MGSEVKQKKCLPYLLTGDIWGKALVWLSEDFINI